MAKFINVSTNPSLPTMVNVDQISYIQSYNVGCTIFLNFTQGNAIANIQTTLSVQDVLTMIANAK